MSKTKQGDGWFITCMRIKYFGLHLDVRWGLTHFPNNGHPSIGLDKSASAVSESSGKSEDTSANV